LGHRAINQMFILIYLLLVLIILLHYFTFNFARNGVLITWDFQYYILYLIVHSRRVRVAGQITCILGKGNYNLSVRNSKEEPLYLVAQGHRPPHWWGFLITHNYKNTHTHKVRLLWISDPPVPETTNYKTHNKHKRKYSKHLAGFEPPILANKRLQNYALYSKATETGTIN
jgi:hypothetical protein